MSRLSDRALLVATTVCSFASFIGGWFVLLTIPAVAGAVLVGVRIDRARRE